MSTSFNLSRVIRALASCLGFPNIRENIFAYTTNKGEPALILQSNHQEKTQFFISKSFGKRMNFLPNKGNDDIYIAIPVDYKLEFRVEEYQLEGI